MKTTTVPFRPRTSASFVSCPCTSLSAKSVARVPSSAGNAWVAIKDLSVFPGRLARRPGLEPASKLAYKPEGAHVVSASFLVDEAGPSCEGRHDNGVVVASRGTPPAEPG